MSELIPTELTELNELSLRSNDAGKMLVNGNGAVAWAAFESGVSYFSHYPGSPVAQIDPQLKRLAKEHHAQICFNDSLNEHIALLCAAGASFAGARSMVVMKHVGLNIAADPLNYLGYTGVNGGLVLIVGTDPGANSSTGEEDTHSYATQAGIPIFEPTSVKEIHSCVTDAFEVSEKYKLPVFVFLPGRIAYNSDFINVSPKNRKKVPQFFFKKDPDRYVNVGAKAVENHRKLLERLSLLQNQISRTRIFFNSNAKLGLITRGATLGHTYESILKLGLQDQVQLLNLDLVYPLPTQVIQNFSKTKNKIIVIEDQDGFLESLIKTELYNDLDVPIYGKTLFPKFGEITYSIVTQRLAEEFNIPLNPPRSSIEVPERLGTFCEGCPHRSTYYTIDEVIRGTQHIIGGDIGCSSLPPQRADWLMCMNSGIGISQGMSQALSSQNSEQVVISTGGEGTFFHGGFTHLQSAVLNQVDLLHLVFDNRSIAMTGHQDSPTTQHKIDYKKLLEAIGVQRFFEVDAFDPLGFANRLKTELKTKGVRVLWVKGDCALQPNEETKKRRKTKFIAIQNEKCGDCNKCYQDLACPAILRLDPTSSARDLKINLDRCMRCGVCIEICPNDAISIEMKNER